MLCAFFGIGLYCISSAVFQVSILRTRVVPIGWVFGFCSCFAACFVLLCVFLACWVCRDDVFLCVLLQVQRFKPYLLYVG